MRLQYIKERQGDSLLFQVMPYKDTVCKGQLDEGKQKRLPPGFRSFAPPVADEAERRKLAKRAMQALRSSATIEQAEWLAAAGD